MTETGERAAPGVDDVGDLAFDAAVVVAPERQMPERVLRLQAEVDEFARQGVVIAHDPGVMRTEGDHARAGQGGDVHHRRRLEPRHRHARRSTR